MGGRRGPSLEATLPPTSSVIASSDSGGTATSSRRRRMGNRRWRRPRPSDPALEDVPNGVGDGVPGGVGPVDDFE